MIRINKNGENANFYFYCVPYGTVEIQKMVVKQLLIDDYGNKYLVFFSTNNKYKYYVRGYIGELSEEKFYKIKSESLIDEICDFLNAQKLVAG